jgi:hypothetical membrane protein
MKNSLVKYFSLGGLFTSVLFTVMTVICSSLRSGYDQRNQFISELGATSTGHATLMNYGGFIPSGFMTILFAIALLYLLPKSVIGRFGITLIGLFGIGVILAGFFSCDKGCPQDDGSFANMMHNAVSGPAFLSVIIGIFLLSLAFRRSIDWNRFWIYSLISSLVATLFMMLLLNSIESRELTGLWQRLLLAVIFLWLSVISVNLFRFNRRRLNVQ